MDILPSSELIEKQCKPCEGGVEPCTLPESQEQLTKLEGWYLTNDGQRIRKDWTVTDFMAGIRFFNEVARVSEEEAHHPDLHIVGYRNVSIEIWTHAIGGLSENDFILAAKVDQLSVELKS